MGSVHWKNGFRQIVFAEIPCNWFQCQENSIDPVHFEWIHSNWSIRLGGSTGPYTPQHVKVDFSEFDYGFQYKRIRTDTSERDRLWTVGRVCLWPNGLFTGNHVEFRVPIDDENTLSVMWHFSRVPREQEPYVQNSIPTWQGPIVDHATGRWITSHVMNQDFVTWVGQGRIADRSQEYLAQSDRGIVMIRRRFLDDIKAVAEGRIPKAIIRDPALNRMVALPVAEREVLIEGLSRAELMDNPLARRGLQGYIFQTAQPAEVRGVPLAAMGFSEAEATAEPRPFDPLAPSSRRPRGPGGQRIARRGIRRVGASLSIDRSRSVPLGLRWGMGLAAPFRPLAVRGRGLILKGVSTRTGIAFPQTERSA